MLVSSAAAIGADYHGALLPVLASFASAATPQGRAMDLPSSLADFELLETKTAGEGLFDEGEAPEGLWLLCSGTIDLIFSTRRGRKPLRVLKAPQTIGVSELISHRRYGCTAVASTECLVGFITNENFFRVLDNNSETWMAVLEMLGSEVAACYQSFRNINAKQIAA